MKSSGKEKYEKIRKALSKKKDISTGTSKVDFENELKCSKKQACEIIEKSRIKNCRRKVALDIGSGAGHNTIALSEFFSKAYGIEIQKDLYEMGLIKKKHFKKNNVFFKNTGNENLPFDDNYFDFITSVTVLEHVADVDKSLDEITRVLKKDGLFYLACPNYFWIYEGHYHYFMLPLMPKFIFKIIAKIKGDDPSFIDGINYITDKSVKRKLKERDLLNKRDYSLDALNSVLVKGDFRNLPKHYQNFLGVIKLVRFLRLGGAFYWAITAFGFYPSIELLVSKP